MKHIRSRENPQFKKALRLSRSGRERRQEGLMLLDGDHLIEAALKSGIFFAMLAMAESAADHPARRRLFDTIPCGEKLLLPDQLLALLSPVVTASGLVALASVPAPTPLPDDCERSLLLEGIQDPGNLGTILRTAAAAGIRQIALAAGCASVWSPKVLRAGMGAQFTLSMHENEDLPALARRLKAVKVATSPRAKLSLHASNLAQPVAWLFGGEGAGLSAQLMKISDLVVGIPMPGPVESLNVSCAVAICLFEQVRQRT